MRVKTEKQPGTTGLLHLRAPKNTRGRKTAAVVLGAALVLSSIVLPVAAGLDLAALLKLFGLGYVVDLFSEQLNSFVNTVTLNYKVENRDATKVVPIVSVGTGIYVGAAQVSGARDRVAQVQAVGEIEGEFMNDLFRARVLVPLDNKNPLQGIRRVPGVGVSAIIDLRVDSLARPGAPGFPPGAPETPGTPPNPPPPARRAAQYAIFADEELTIDGERIRILGDVHVNGNLEANGEDIGIIGNLAVGGDLNAAEEELNVEGRTIWRSAYVTMPRADFAVLRARAQKVYLTSVNISGYTSLKGIIFVDGDVYISGQISGTGGIAATGRIYIGRNGVRYVTPNSALLLLSGKDIEAGKTESRIDAFLAAPYGLIRVGGHNMTVRGGLMGRRVELDGEQITVIHDESPPDWLNAGMAGF